MKHAHRTDFWFAGVAVLPVVFLFAGRPEAILMLYFPLLIVACSASQLFAADESTTPMLRFPTATTYGGVNVRFDLHVFASSQT